MKTIGPLELKKIQLEILDCVHQFCVKNHINYWLDSGTLIGAIRHKGYIPWDDDIDLGMLRDDYDKFLTIFNESNNRYKCYSIENNNSFYYPFAKVLDTTTLLFEPDEKGNKLSINIDIFPYDEAPCNRKEAIKMYKKRNLYQRLRSLANHNAHSGGFLRKMLITIASIPFKLFPKGYFDKKLVKNAKNAYKSGSHIIGNFTSREIVFARDSIFASFIDVEFEGRMYKAPIGYDEWLKNFYGDYMTLPPVNERTTHHIFKAFVVDGK